MPDIDPGAAAPPGRVVMTDIRDEALSLDEIVSAVSDPACGGVSLFLGVVRDHDHGQAVQSLDYSVHPTAGQRLAEVAQVVAARSNARLAVVHRSGQLRVGDLAVVVAAAAPHRDGAFSACRDLIDTVKAEVPIWKHQHLGDGVSEWVGLA